MEQQAKIETYGLIFTINFETTCIPHFSSLYKVFRHLARALAFSTQSEMLLWTLVLHAPTSLLSFPFPSSFWVSFSTCWLGCALCFLYVPLLLTLHILLKQFPIEAMEMKQPDAQESQELPVPPELPPPASAPASSTTETLTPEEMELIKKHRAATRTSSRKKKPRTEQGWEDFLSALSAKDGELSDFGLQQNYELHLKPEQIFLLLTSLHPMLFTMILIKANLRRLTSPKRYHVQTCNQ